LIEAVETAVDDDTCTRDRAQLTPPGPPLTRHAARRRDSPVEVWWPVAARTPTGWDDTHAIAIKIAGQLVDREGVGGGENSQQLANSMLGALLAVAREAAGDAGVSHILTRAGERRSLEDLERPSGLELI